MIDNSSEIERWHKEQGEQIYKKSIILSSGDIVFDLGAYNGRWANKIAKETDATIFSFEPVPCFFNEASIFNKDIDRIKMFNVALGPKTQTCSIYLNNDGSSLFQKSDKTCEIRMLEIRDFIIFNNIKKIDLIKINIEGAEYDLLDYMIKLDMLKNINSIYVQFHGFMEDAEIRREKIRKSLFDTHEIIFDYPFVWEGWKKQ